MTLAERVATLLGETVASVERLGGGDISVVHRCRLANGVVVIAKQSDAVAQEAAMLRAIRATGAQAPQVLAEDPALLVMAALPDGGSLASAWDNLAAVLAMLHAAEGRAYGWSADYAFGPVAIRNAESDHWPHFWADRRLRCHLPHLPPALARRIDRLAATLGERLPARPRASLLHGDLWGGNILVDGDRVSGLIDPACYHGDREVDAAMPTLFDAPPARFFDALALDPGWRDRQPIYRLWPLLVHLRLFGVRYMHAISRELDALGV